MIDFISGGFTYYSYSSPLCALAWFWGRLGSIPSNSISKRRSAFRGIVTVVKVNKTEMVCRLQNINHVISVCILKIFFKGTALTSKHLKHRI
jgi:hypothetical protein